ncbi:MAG: lysophospholipid acyltransferase family protein [Gemmatimonadetes bacterium]|nr:lysophospholipid acyltransferase family protein [Gemmatimonadota bacterium]
MTAPPTGTARTAAPATSWRVTLGVPLGWALLRLLGFTWRVEYRFDAAWRGMNAARAGNVLALWHGQLLPLAFAVRKFPMRVLVSEHRDGEIIARLLIRLGFSMIRGSSTRGGARALIQMVRELKEGATVAITPDGPRGPARKFSPGALVAAQRASVPIVTMHATVSRSWQLRSWDSFIIPKPFARIIVDFSAPTYVEADTPAGAALEAPRFEALLRAREEQVGE